MKRELNALIEGGLSRTTGFEPTNGSIKTAVTWLEHRLKAARIPLVNMRYVLAKEPHVFVLECNCCIATFKERTHNEGVAKRFVSQRPVAGTSRSCWVEVRVEFEGDAVWHQ